MKINQIFTMYIEDNELLSDLLQCFNLRSLDDTTIFCVNDLIVNNSISKFNTNIYSKLKPYYLPCKAKIYLENISENKLITILRQVVRLFDYKVCTTKKSKNKVKTIFYYLNNKNIHDVRKIYISCSNKYLLKFE